MSCDLKRIIVQKCTEIGCVVSKSPSSLELASWTLFSRLKCFLKGPPWVSLPKMTFVKNLLITWCPEPCGDNSRLFSTWWMRIQNIWCVQVLIFDYRNMFWSMMFWNNEDYLWDILLSRNRQNKHGAWVDRKQMSCLCSLLLHRTVQQNSYWSRYPQAWGQ